MSWGVVDNGDGLPMVILTEPSGSSATVSLYGGQVLSWKNNRHEELLFASKKAIPPRGRGGIPIFFPQIDKQHVLARNRLWKLDTPPSPLPRFKRDTSVDLILKSTNEDLKMWAHSYELRLRVILSPGSLTLIPRVKNTDNKPFSFTFLIRNYLSVSDISEVRVEGLETLDYYDNLVNGNRFTEQADAMTFDREVDRVYLGTPTKIAIIDHEKKRTFVLRKECLPDAGVWNPSSKKTKALPDFGDKDYKVMLCIDSGVTEIPILLKPFEEWKSFQELSIVPSSYCSGSLDPCKVLAEWN